MRCKDARSFEHSPVDLAKSALAENSQYGLQPGYEIELVYVCAYMGLVADRNSRTWAFPPELSFALSSGTELVVPEHALV